MDSGPAPTAAGAEPPAPPAASREETASPKSYAIAVALSGIFGFVGVQHFYLGRYVEGAIDVALTIGWVSCFLILGEPVYGLLFLAADLAHSFIVSIMLMIGAYRDGQGRLVCYPGQRLPTRSD
jgi:hypothetical protein